MTLKLTTEQFHFLQMQPSPVVIEDQETQVRYVILPQDDYRRLLDEELRRELQIAFDQKDAGEEAEWDVEAVIAEAKRRFGRECS